MSYVLLSWMDALIGRLCDRLEAGGTRLGSALAAIWRGGRQPPTDPEDPATSSVSALCNLFTHPGMYSIG